MAATHSPARRRLRPAAPPPPGATGPPHRPAAGRSGVRSGRPPVPPSGRGGDAQPLLHPLFRLRRAHDIRHHRGDVGAGCQNVRQPLERHSTDRHPRQRPDAAPPYADARQSLRRPRHHFEQRRINRAERHVVGSEPERAFELALVVRADAEPHAGAAQCHQVRAVELPLPQGDEIAAGLERCLPVIIDDQLRARRETAGARRNDLGTHHRGRLLLDAQLHQPYSERREPRDPGGAVDDRIDARQLHPRNAVPMSGVEGAAISRGSIGPASRAAAPASTARANAAAICTGSRACATAVLTSTASKPSSSACAACEGTPRPASMMSGTSGKCARNARRPNRLLRPRPEPIGAPHGLSPRQPAGGSRSATTRSSVVYGNTSNPSAHSSRAASVSPKTSGCSVSSSPITSSLIQVVPNTSRAICAVVSASLTLWQPAVLGSTRTPSSRTSDQNACPERSPPDSRRSDTVTTPARGACPAAASTAGEG